MSLSPILILFTLEDGLVIETVVIPSDTGRNTVCVSTFKLSGLCSELSVLLHWQGMGEALLNIDNVLKAAEIMQHDQGLHFSPRIITVSTSGLVPQLRCFLKES